MKRPLPPQFSKEKGCKFVVFEPAPEDIKVAFQRSKRQGVLPNSFTYGAGRMTGFLGELAFEHLYPEASYVGGTSLDHDFVLGRRKIDVKSKTCGSPPLLHYTASVNCAAKVTPKASYYYFVRVDKDLTKAWLLGWVTRKALLTEGEFKKRGDEDSSGFMYRASGYHIPLKSLRSPLSWK